MIEQLAQIKRDLDDLQSRVARMVAAGKVVQQDPAGYRVRVQLPGHDHAIPGWLPVLTQRAHQRQAYSLPALGEQVWCVFLPVDGLQAGVVIGSTYHTNAPVPVTDAAVWRHQFSDGAQLAYHEKNHALTIHSAGDLTIRAGGACRIRSDGDLWIDAPHVHVFEGD